MSELAIGIPPHHPATRASRPALRAFSLIELLVVLAIIGIVAGISLPGLRGMGKANSMDSAVRQVMDDLALARARALNGRTTVHVIFVPPTISSMAMASWSSDAHRVGNQLLDAAYRSYRLFAPRRVGDQPGRGTPHYMDQWKTLPEGVIFATNHFSSSPSAQWTNGVFETTGVPFPTSDAGKQTTPHLAFGPEGGLVDVYGNRIFQGQIIQLSLGSVLSQRKADGTLDYYDVRELPPGSGAGDPVQIRIDGFTGQASIVRQEVQ